MKKLLALALSAAMVFSLAACGSAPAAPAAPAEGEAAVEVEAEAAAEPGVLNVCLASEPATLDPALNSSVDGATMTAHLFSGLSKWAQDENGALVLVADAAEELVPGVENEDGTVTYTYTLRDGLKWSDGQPVTAGDFEFAWNRAASVERGAAALCRRHGGRRPGGQDAGQAERAI